MSRALSFLKKEFLELLPPTLFFLVVFHVVVWARSLLGVGSGFTMVTSAAATLGALVVGKSILIADALPMFEWFRDRRLVYNVAWRAFLYMSVAFVFQVLEELIPMVSKYGGVAAAGEHLIGEIDAPRFWATHMILAMFLIVYSLVTALIMVIGAERFLEAFFGWSKTSGSQSDAAQ